MTTDPTSPAAYYQAVMERLAADLKAAETERQRIWMLPGTEIHPLTPAERKQRREERRAAEDAVTYLSMAWGALRGLTATQPGSLAAGITTLERVQDDIMPDAQAPSREQAATWQAAPPMAWDQAGERVPAAHSNLPAGLLADAADVQLELAAQQEDARRIVLGEPLTAERARQITDYYQRSADQ